MVTDCDAATPNVLSQRFRRLTTSGAIGFRNAGGSFYPFFLIHQRVMAKPIPPNRTVKPDIPVTMVTHVPIAPETTNPQTHIETLATLLISFISVSVRHHQILLGMKLMGTGSHFQVVGLSRWHP